MQEIAKDDGIVDDDDDGIVANDGIIADNDLQRVIDNNSVDAEMKTSNMLHDTIESSNQSKENWNLLASIFHKVVFEYNAHFQ